MSEPLWRTAKCMSCKNENASIVIVRWGFDKDGTFLVYGVCRWCYRSATITHNREEQDGDIREAFNQWTENGGPEADDFYDWETELMEDDDGT